MSNWKGNDDECPICELKYHKLRTGFTYAEIRMILWIGDPDYEKWKYKRRHTVLGLWFSIKQSMWAQHLVECEQMLMYYEAQQLKAKEEQELREIVANYENRQGDDEDDLSDIPF